MSEHIDQLIREDQAKLQTPTYNATYTINTGSRVIHATITTDSLDHLDLIEGIDTGAHDNPELDTLTDDERYDMEIAINDWEEIN